MREIESWRGNEGPRDIEMGERYREREVKERDTLEFLPSNTRSNG